MGKTRIIAETGAGQHGVATATVCARFGLPCVVYMGATDIERQAPNVFRMKLLGAEVKPVTSGSGTLKDAMNEALRDWVANVEDTYYIIGTAAGPHPYPAMVRDFQSVIGTRRASRCWSRGPAARHAGRLHRRRLQRHRPVPPVPRRPRRSRSSASRRPATASRRATRLADRRAPGVLHGNRTYLLQDEDGQILEATRSRPASTIPASGPEHSWLKDTGRVEYVSATDQEALDAFQLCARSRASSRRSSRRTRWPM
jgi:tryptophan synthase beta chain